MVVAWPHFRRVMAGTHRGVPAIRVTLLGRAERFLRLHNLALSISCLLAGTRLKLTQEER